MDCVDAGLGSIQSNPGPTSARIRPEGVSEAVVESLTLTVVDTSDEEPLVRATTGRHVVRRVGERSSVARPEKFSTPPDVQVCCGDGRIWVRVSIHVGSVCNSLFDWP